VAANASATANIRTSSNRMKHHTLGNKSRSDTIIAPPYSLLW
jgi:hypothetical protein